MFRKFIDATRNYTALRCQEEAKHAGKGGEDRSEENRRRWGDETLWDGEG